MENCKTVLAWLKVGVKRLIGNSWSVRLYNSLASVSAATTTTTKNTHLYQGGSCRSRTGRTAPPYQLKSRNTVAVTAAVTLV